MKIIVAPASFKGSISNIEAADIMKKASLKVFPRAEIVVFPLADGGEGTLDVIKKLSGGTLKHASVSGPLSEEIKARWLRKGRTAFIEMAEAAGLALLSDSEKDPLETTTFGVGQLIEEAAVSGCRDIFMGVGGSATNDGGIGALTALGVKFFKKGGSVIYPGAGKDLSEIHHIDMSEMSAEVKKSVITILCDVENPLYGKNGAAYVYGPQKGADNKAVKKLDHGLRSYARVLKETTGMDVADIPGAGAAGGIVAGLAALLNAKTVSGIDKVMDMGNFMGHLNSSDILLTGEGGIDSQTVSGKSLGKIFSLAERYGVLTIALAGSVDGAMYEKNYRNVVLGSIQPGPVSLKTAMKNCPQNLYNTVTQVLKLYGLKSSHGTEKRKLRG